MGYYLEPLKGGIKGKADALISEGATEIDKPFKLDQIPQDKALICVVQNAVFDACSLAFSQQELEAFDHIDDNRPKRWLLMDKEIAHKRAKYPK